MQYYKPVFKENDLKIYETLKKQFRDSFTEPPKGTPRRALETCDLHLYQKQPFLYVDPRGNGVNEVTWNEPKDIIDYWKGHERKLWFIIFFTSAVFFLIIYYFWGL